LTTTGGLKRAGFSGVRSPSGSPSTRPDTPDAVNCFSQPPRNSPRAAERSNSPQSPRGSNDRSTCMLSPRWRQPPRRPPPPSDPRAQPASPTHDHPAHWERRYCEAAYGVLFGLGCLAAPNLKGEPGEPVGRGSLGIRWRWTQVSRDGTADPQFRDMGLVTPQLSRTATPGLDLDAGHSWPSRSPSSGVRTLAQAEAQSRLFWPPWNGLRACWLPPASWRRLALVARHIPSTSARTIVESGSPPTRATSTQSARSDEPSLRSGLNSTEGQLRHLVSFPWSTTLG